MLESVGPRAILPSMAEAIIVHVTTEAVTLGVRESQFWIVATGDRAVAESAVRARVSIRCVVEATDHKVSPATIRALGLAAGQAWPL